MDFLVTIIERLFPEAISAIGIASEKALAMTSRSRFSSLEDMFDFIRYYNLSVLPWVT